MRAARFITILMTALSICAFNVLPASASTTPLKINKIIVFGDSLSDNGNFYKLTDHIMPISPPYFDGRFTNGQIWAENLAQSLNVSTEDKAQFLDYAYAGTWASDDIPEGSLGLVSLAWEINEYLTRDSSHGTNAQEQLLLMWIGANDYLDGRLKETPEDATNKTIMAVERNLELLLNDGARNILILNLPNLGLAPSVVAGGAELSARVSKLSYLHNQKLSALIAKLQQQYPEVHLMPFDVTGYMNDVLSNPGKYQFSNVTDACYTGDYGSLEPEGTQEIASNNPQDYICSTPDAYIYWDQTHPSAAIHRLLAGYAEDFVKARLNLG